MHEQGVRRGRRGGVRPSAVLWDFDGTLVDTEPIWVDVEQQMMAALDTPWTREQGASLAGSSWLAASLRMIEEIGDPTIDPWQFYVQRYHLVAEQIRLREVPWRPGAQQLLGELNQVGVPCGLVSASARPVLDAALDRIGHDSFGVIVDGDMVSVGKPDPEGYLQAADQLGVPIEQCLVIEDSRTGCEAGHRSGAVVLAVPCMTQLPARPGQVTVDSLSGLGLHDLPTIWATGAAERRSSRVLLDERDKARGVA